MRCISRLTKHGGREEMSRLLVYLAAFRAKSERDEETIEMTSVNHFLLHKLLNS